MIKKICFFALIGVLAAKGAFAWSISIPAETKILSERLTDCEPFEYTRQNIFDIKLNIKGREDELCVISLDLTDLESRKKRQYDCKISDFNIEEVKLAFEEATLELGDIGNDVDDNVILDLFEGFKKNNICR